MSSEEKTRPIEQLSISPTNSDSDLDSPSWHHDALRQTAQRYEGGHERPIGWSTAKGELRKLAERTSLLDHS